MHGVFQYWETTKQSRVSLFISVCGLHAAYQAVGCWALIQQSRTCLVYACEMMRGLARAARQYEVLTGALCCHELRA